MKAFDRIEKTKKEARLEREATRGKIQDHSNVSEDTIKQRLNEIVTETKDPLRTAKFSIHDVFKERNIKGSVLDQYCFKYGVDTEDTNMKTRIAQIVSRTLKKDIRLVSNEEYISTKRNTLTRMLASHGYHGIFPALLPQFTPSINLCIQFDHPTYGDILVYRGNTLSPTLTSTQPKVIFTGRSDIDCHYTLIMTDLDYPSVYEPSGRSLVHWVVGNIPNTGDITSADFVVPFLPPIPAIGTRIHRIAFVLFQQTTGKRSIQLNHPISEISDREKFNVEEFAKTNNLLPVGLSFFQTKWDEEVSNTYRSLDIQEPQYVEEERIEKLERRFVVPQQNTYNFKPVPIDNL